MSTVDINGTTVYVTAVESVADGVSKEYDRLWDRAVSQSMLKAWRVVRSEDMVALDKEFDKVEFPKREDHPAVIVKLTSGREFRIVGKTRAEVEEEIRWAKRRG